MDFLNRKARGPESTDVPSVPDPDEEDDKEPHERKDSGYHYVIGIDLGTTNSAVAWVSLDSEQGARGMHISVMEVPQLVTSGQLARRQLFPSFLYLPGPHELPAGSTALPWDKSRDYAVGEFARDQGSRVPGRLVSSAKSWLCHAGVDRTAPILPWGAKEDVVRVSPVEASARYLQHLREAWNEEIAAGRESHFLENQLVILTVPASFDEVARELTVAAADQAGIKRLILLEEPLAAFYSWLSRNEGDLGGRMTPGQVIWVCDVGGGTTDFTVVAIREGQQGLRFDRLAVGEHLMLGGDNMDLTLARHLEQALAGQGGKLEAGRWRELCLQCRSAKEVLLGSGDAETAPDARREITVLGSGGRLITGTLRGTLTRAEVEQQILEGFFPSVPLNEAALDGASRTGLTELGLPYVQDPAVTRHMAAFWSRFEGLLVRETGRKQVYPDFLLFNGGALKPASIRNRLRSVVRRWFQDVASEGWSPHELLNPDLDLAVAVGAAYYGLVRLGKGVRVGAGSPRAFYVQVDFGLRQGVPGRRPAVCLLPRGTEEGFETELAEQQFEVLANQPAAFQLLSSSTRLGDRLGARVELEDQEITVFPQIRTVLRHGRKGTARRLPVQLAVRLTEIGTLELWCRSRESPHRWQLSFDVRQQVQAPESSRGPSETIDMATAEEAQKKIRIVFGGGAAGPGEAPESLARTLPAALMMKKERWPTALIRKLADTLLEVQQGRADSAAHEERWLNLLGFCLRPGFGDPVDDWRIKEAWKVFLKGLSFPKQVTSRTELWIFLRRIAGGLSGGQQWRVYQDLSAAVLPEGGRKKKVESPIPRRLNPQEEIELWMCLANFERLPADTKAELGRILLERVRRKIRPQEIWALSRLGARVPFYGPADRVVPSKEVSSWLGVLLSADLPPREAAAHALVQLARLTGDRVRDVSEKDRRKVSEWLEQVPQKERFRDLLTRPESSWEKAEQDWVFGESLPTGLVLTASSPPTD